VFRDFSITERFILQFRAEAFSVTNTPQFAQFTTTSTGASALTRNADGSIKLNGFGEITTATGERQFRFALKLSF